MSDEAVPVSPYEVPAGQVEAICQLVASVPKMDGVLAEHVADNDEVLPYVLINDLARSYVAAVADGEIDTVRKLVAAVEFLGVSPDQGVRGLLTEFVSGLVAGADFLLDFCGVAAGDAVTMVGPDHPWRAGGRRSGQRLW